MSLAARDVPPGTSWAFGGHRTMAEAMREDAMPDHARKPVDALRRSLYGKIEIAKKQLALDDDAYRDILEVRYGVRSRTQMSTARLVDLVEHFKTLGFKPVKKVPARARGRGAPSANAGRPLADGATQRKIRALWISLYHLGLVREPSESALTAFVRRQAGVDDPRWLAPGAAFRVIEALKSWAARASEKGGAGVDWAPYAGSSGPRENPRARVMEAQWRLLHAAGAVTIASTDALERWAELVAGARHRTSYIHLPPDEADRTIEALGKKVRALRKRKKEGQP